MTDSLMSGWVMTSGLSNKYLVLVVVCDTYTQARTIVKNAEKRPEMKDINIRNTKPSYPTSKYLTTWKQYTELGDVWTK
jgi:hypothetical protein